MRWQFFGQCPNFYASATLLNKEELVFIQRKAKINNKISFGDDMNVPFKVFLKPGREKSVLGKHPWVFSGGVGKIFGDGKSGSLAEVYNSLGVFLGLAFYNSNSDIALRFLTFSKANFDEQTLGKRIADANFLRKKLISDDTNCYRAVNGEGDFLPGLVVDRFDDVLCCQFLCAGMENLQPQILELLMKEFSPVAIFLDETPYSRVLEKLPRNPHFAYGNKEKIVLKENGMQFELNLLEGQKTGFFLDQRGNREFTAKLAAGLNLGLDVFCYTGAFSLAMLRGGLSSVRLVDSSRAAMDLARNNLINNGFGENLFTLDLRDAFDALHSTPAYSQDIIVLDPPAFAKKALDEQKAASAYKDLNLCALKSLRSGGFLCTFSCSPFVDFKLFVQIVFGALRDSGRQAQILRKSHHNFDHPQNLAHIEGEYLKGLFLRVF